MKTRWITFLLLLILVTGIKPAMADLTNGDVKIQGNMADLEGIKEISIRCEVSELSRVLHFAGNKNSSTVTTDVIINEVTDFVEKYGLSVNSDAPTMLTIEFDTPGGSLMTFVNFFVSEKVVFLRDKAKERNIHIWMATGYERGKIYPQPVRRLSHAFIQQWAMANNNSISLQAERQPDVLVVKLLPRKKFEFNNQIYAYSQLLSVLANITDVQQKLIKVQSAWQTRSDAGTIFKIIKDAGFNAKIDFKFGQGGKDEQSFMDEWQNIMKGADQKSP